jgi:hypothetical protein
LLTGYDVGAMLHQIGHAATISRTLNDEVADQSDGFRMVQLDPPFQPATGDSSGHGNKKLVFLTWR